MNDCCDADRCRLGDAPFKSSVLGDVDDAREEFERDRVGVLFGDFLDMILAGKATFAAVCWSSLTFTGTGISLLELASSSIEASGICSSSNSGESAVLKCFAHSFVLYDIATFEKRAGN